LGYQTYGKNVLWRSIPTCFFFDAFSAKMLLLRSERLPGVRLLVLPHVRSDDMTDGSTRRTMLTTGASALAVCCVGCSNGNGSSSSSESPAASASASESASASASASAEASSSGSASAAAGKALAQTSEIPEGGGMIFKEQKIVVTQPKKGEYKAFSAICTHQGCTVSQVTDGTINCPCHGSKFHIADGSVAHGPATRPLPAKSITVTGNSITLG
jgi:Rieske Fe-S protein